MWYVHIYREPPVRMTEFLKVRRLSTKHKAMRLHLVTRKVDGQVRILVAVVHPITVSQAIQVCRRRCAQYPAVLRGLIRGELSLSRFNDDMSQTRNVGGVEC